jgi:spore coat protein U-like protein
MSNANHCKTRPAHSAIKCVAIVIGLVVATGAIASINTVAAQQTPCDIHVDAATYPDTIMVTVTY